MDLQREIPRVPTSFVAGIFGALAIENLGGTPIVLVNWEEGIQVGLYTLGDQTLYMFGPKGSFWAEVHVTLDTLASVESLRESWESVSRESALASATTLRELLQATLELDPN